MKNLHTLTFFVRLLISGGVFSQTVPFYIIIGQSNTGWASSNEMNPTQAASYKGVIPNTEIWNPARGAWGAQWENMNVGVNTMPENYADPAQFGPEAALFSRLQTQESKKRLVYKQGQGGTTLAGDWRPPSPGPFMYQAGPRFKQFYEWLEIAATQAAQKGYKLDLKAIVWMQGEDDAKTQVDASAYQANLTNFFFYVNEIWAYFSYLHSFPTNPYKRVIGRIYAPVAYPFRDMVRSAQAAYCADDSHNAIMINCDSYPLQDWVHYNATGQIQFGTDIFNALNVEPVAATGVSVSGKVMLQGAYNAGTGLMSNTLNTLGILQTRASAQPYTHTSFGYNGTEQVNAGFFAAHTDIVDWILLELRDAANTSTIVSRRAAFVKRDGTIVDIDGANTQVTFPGVAKGNYYISVRHRNHLAIRSASPVNFTTGSAEYNFTSSASASYQSQGYTSTIQMGSNFLMRGGNANINTNVKFNGPQNDQDRIQNIELGGSISMVVNTVYSADDINMDGSIKTNGPNNDQNFLLNVVLGGLIGNVFNQQL